MKRTRRDKREERRERERERERAHQINVFKFIGMSESLNLGDGIHEHLIINGRMPAAFNNTCRPSLFKKYIYFFEAFMHEWHIVVSTTVIRQSE